MKKRITELKWSIIFTLVGLLWMVLEKVVGLHDEYIDYHLYLTNLFAIPAIWMMVKALQEKKKKDYQGSMHYMQGFISGIVLSLLIALWSPIAQWITSYMITPEYFPNVIKRSVELGYYKNTELAAAQFNYPNYAIQGAIGALVMGVVTTALAMIWIQTKKEKHS